ncbi:hypothetical protein BGZ81_003763 [Podila clonocystis]|nr:hypothetical protein BGZ81_003763 [Podila clonocystis]
MSRFKAIPESGYKHHMGLAFGGLSSGVMKIEPDREKPNRLAHAGTVIFYVTKGRVTATINNSTFVVTAGGQFMVPRGNQYSIKNVSREDSIIFYARVKAHDAEPVTVPACRRFLAGEMNTDGVEVDSDESRSFFRAVDLINGTATKVLLITIKAIATASLERHHAPEQALLAMRTRTGLLTPLWPIAIPYRETVHRPKLPSVGNKIKT